MPGRRPCEEEDEAGSRYLPSDVPLHLRPRPPLAGRGQSTLRSGDHLPWASPTSDASSCLLCPPKPPRAPRALQTPPRPPPSALTPGPRHPPLRTSDRPWPCLEGSPLLLCGAQLHILLGPPPCFPCSSPVPGPWDPFTPSLCLCCAPSQTASVGVHGANDRGRGEGDTDTQGGWGTCPAHPPLFLLPSERGLEKAPQSHLQARQPGDRPVPGAHPAPMPARVTLKTAVGWGWGGLRWQGTLSD